MHTYLRNKPVWIQLIIFGGLTGGILALSFIIGFNAVARANHMSVAQLLAMRPADYARPELSGVIKGMLVVQFFGFFFVPSLVFAYLADPFPLRYAGLIRPQRYYYLGIAALTLIAGYFTVEFLGVINQYLVQFLPASAQKWVASGEEDANGTLKNILSMNTRSELFMTIFLVGALPAIGEELFFRGILQKLFIQIFKKPWPGIIFTAFLFSAIHMQFMGFLPRMALGVILGALYWFSGSIFTSMLGHFLYNTINILLIYFKVADLDSQTRPGLGILLIGLASLAVVIFLLNGLRKKSTTRYATEFPPRKEYTIFDEPENPA